MTYDSNRDEIIEILNKVFLNIKNELYTKENMKYIIDFIDIYFSKKQKLSRTEGIMNSCGGIYLLK